jgi:[ribosomal protein S5]-alanine N-acetyltransferase
VDKSEQSARARGEWPTDIETSRLLLRCLSPDSIRSGLSGDAAAIERQLGAHVPTDLVREPKVLEFAAARLAEDANYLPWSARALILKATAEMVGHLRFNTLPDPDYLKSCARDAIEFGYVVFPAHRRRGYAFEAVVGAMDWAKRHGVRNFIVTVSPNNAPSLSLVAKAGFRKIGEHIDEVDGLETILLRDETL